MKPIGRKVSWAAICFSMLLVAVSCGGTSAPQPGSPTPGAATTTTPRPAPVKVTMIASWIIDGQRAPWVLAMQKGYLAEEGIDLELLKGTGSVQNAQLVGAGTYQLAEIDGGVVIQSVAAGLPIKAVGGVLQSGAMAIMVPANSSIRTPKDLAGKKLAGVAGSATENFLPGWLRENGVDPASVQLNAMAQDAKRSALTQGTVDGITGYATGDLGFFESINFPVRVIRYSDTGLNVPALVLTGNADWLKANGDVAKRVIRGLMKGLADAKRDPDEALKVLLASDYGKGLDAAQQKVILLKSLDLLTTQRTATTPLGRMSEADWQASIASVEKNLGLKRPVTVNEVMTNDYVAGP